MKSVEPQPAFPISPSAKCRSDLSNQSFPSCVAREYNASIGNPLPTVHPDQRVRRQGIADADGWSTHFFRKGFPTVQLRQRVP